MADFIAEFTYASLDDNTTISDQSSWSLFVDGSSRATGSGTGLILIAPDGSHIQYALRFDPRISNNEAEYEALIVGLELTNVLSI